MTLLTALFAAIITTIIWYHNDKRKALKLGILALMYWGASIMWFADAIFEYVGLGAGYFTPAPADMLNDLFLGMSVIALGLVIWLIIFLISDPKGVVKKTIAGK